MFQDVNKYVPNQHKTDLPDINSSFVFIDILFSRPKTLINWRYEHKRVPGSWAIWRDCVMLKHPKILLCMLFEDLQKECLNYRFSQNTDCF